MTGWGGGGGAQNKPRTWCLPQDRECNTRLSTSSSMPSVSRKLSNGTWLLPGIRGASTDKPNKYHDGISHIVLTADVPPKLPTNWTHRDTPRVEDKQCQRL